MACINDIDGTVTTDFPLAVVHDDKGDIESSLFLPSQSERVGTVGDK